MCICDDIYRVWSRIGAHGRGGGRQSEFLPPPPPGPGHIHERLRVRKHPLPLDHLISHRQLRLEG